MSRIIVQSEKVIAGKPADIYAILADYRERHPHLLTEHFQDYRVEEGGHGAGTVISFRLRAGGRERPYRMRISEPVPGQTLTESDLLSSLTTTWTLTPLEGGVGTRVRIATMWEGGSGIGGFFERTFAPLGLRRIYDQILATLDAVAQGRRPAPVEGTARHGPHLALWLALVGVVIAVPIGLRLLRQRRTPPTLSARVVPAIKLKQMRERARAARRSLVGTTNHRPKRAGVRL